MFGYLLIFLVDATPKIWIYCDVPVKNDAATTS
jgi:hypothetical protein